MYDVPQARCMNMYINTYICHEFLDINYYIFSINIRLFLILKIIWDLTYNSISYKMLLGSKFFNQILVELVWQVHSCKHVVYETRDMCWCVACSTYINCLEQKSFCVCWQCNRNSAWVSVCSGLVWFDLAWLFLNCCMHWLEWLLFQFRRVIE